MKKNYNELKYKIFDFKWYPAGGKKSVNVKY